MAELTTIPVRPDEDEEERKRREVEALNAQPAASSGLAPVVQPTLRTHGKGPTDLQLAEAIDKTRPSLSNVKEVSEVNAPEIGPSAAVNTGLQPLSTSPLKPLSFAERQALPTVSPGAPAGSAASHEAKLERLQDQERNPWGSAENHPGFGGKLAHVLSKVGNVAGTVLAPATMELIPGTDLNRKLEEGREERLGAEAQTRETAAKGEAERERHNTAAEEAENRRLDIEEGKEPNKTIDQKAIDAKTKETNPDTGKPYTDYEARIELANDIAAGKASAKPEAAGKTVTMLDKEGGKPYIYQYDAKGNYSGDEGYGRWKKVGPAKPDALSLGLVGSVQPLIDPTTGQIVGTMNSKTGAFAPLTPAQQEVADKGGTTGAGARTATTRENQFNTQVVNPARAIETNFQKAKSALDAYQKNPQTGAAGMVLFAQHLGTTLGGIKGAAIGEHSQELHRNAIGIADRLSRWIDKNATGQPLAESQTREFFQMIQETRNITWQLAARAAMDRKQKANFLPDDVQIKMKDSKGSVRPVPGNKVQEYLEKGAQIE